MSMLSCGVRLWCLELQSSSSQGCISSLVPFAAAVCMGDLAALA
jgi:hypothetical protein